ncbi:glycosyltransferase involved in cell wall biosynthesis [Geodermatophilus bullaregiensis]|uniref:glycosyltransferase n=1 Tax=Geodermatophilus bullaregiensis TaxID=1564160 RepID=UPI00195A5032|nr:glycosyltransferase [Geodermatophilus bullaregiensis]MBM7808016.1 glycosyltransferase involved in cell wall biosynthesis [Geodermatophilus bullaregiensis]
MTTVRIFAATSYGSHTPMTGGRLRREHLLAGLAGRGHSVDRLTLDARPGPASGTRSLVAAVDLRIAGRIRRADVVLLADVFTAPLVPAVRHAGVPVLLDLCDSPYRLLAEAPRDTPARWAVQVFASAQLLAVMHGLVPMVGRLTYISELDAQVDRRTVRRLPPHSLVHNGIAAELFEVPLDVDDRGYIGWAADWDYPPNQDALRWFAREVATVLPESVLDRVRLFGPRDPLPSLGRARGRLRYAGFVPSLSTLYRGAALLIAPTLWGAGMKNKVLEPLAAGRPVLTTPAGVEGVPVHIASVVDVAEADPRTFARAMEAAVQAAPSPGQAARRRESVRPLTWPSAVEAMESALRAVAEERLDRQV